jgi:hypothetical protein
LKLLYFLPFTENISISFFQKHWSHFLNHLCLVVVVLFFFFGISFFSTILHAFFFKQKQIRQMSSRLIFILFLHVELQIIIIDLFHWSIPAAYIFYFKSSIVLFISLAKKERWSGGGTERARHCNGTQCIIVSQCTHISQSNCLLYPTHIIIWNNEQLNSL